MESFWTQYSVFEDSIIIPTEHRAEERALIAQKQKSVVDDDHKLATEEYFHSPSFIVFRYKRRNDRWQFITLDDLPLHEINRNGQRQIEYWIRAIEYRQTLNSIVDTSNRIRCDCHRISSTIRFT